MPITLGRSKKKSKSSKQANKGQALKHVSTTGSALGSVGKFLTKGGTVSKVLKGAGTVGAVAGVLYGAEQLAEKAGVRGGAGFIGDRMTSSGSRKKSKRINPMNYRAASRAARRLEGARKLLSKIQKMSNKAAGPQRKSSRGYITAAEARGALAR